MRAIIHVAKNKRCFCTKNVDDRTTAERVRKKMTFSDRDLQVLTDEAFHSREKLYLGFNIPVSAVVVFKRMHSKCMHITSFTYVRTAFHPFRGLWELHCFFRSYLCRFSGPKSRAILLWICLIMHWCVWKWEVESQPQKMSNKEESMRKSTIIQ